MYMKRSFLFFWLSIFAMLSVAKSTGMKPFMVSIDGQRETTMQGMIQFCIEDYLSQDSILCEENIKINGKNSVSKFICSEGLPRSFDYSSMPDYYFHTLNRHDIKRIFKMIHKSFFSSLFIYINLENACFHVSVWSVGVSKRFLGRKTRLLLTDNVRKYIFQFDSQANCWVLQE